MQVELTARDGASTGGGVDVVVRCPEGTPLRAVVPALAAVTGSRSAGTAGRAGPVVSAGGRVLDTAWPVGLPPLVRGAEVVLHGADPGSPDAPAADRGPVLRVVGGPGSGERTPLPLGRSWVGEGDGSLLPVASGRRAPHGLQRLELDAGPTGARVRSTGRGSAVLLDGRPLSGAWRSLPAHGVLEVGRTRLALRPGPLPALPADGPAPRWCAPDARGHLRVEASPPPLQGGSADGEGPGGRDALVTLPPAPQRRPPTPVAWPAVLVPLLVAVPLALLWSPLALLLGLSGPLVVLLTRAAEHRSSGRQLRRDLAEHARAVVVARVRARRLADAQLADLEHLHPDPAALREAAESRGPRLWSRPGDTAPLRLGSAPTPSRTVLTDTPDGSPDGPPGDSPGERLHHTRAPVVLDLVTGPALELRGPTTARWGVLRCLLLQLAVLHPPEQLQLALPLDGERGAGCAWARWLPHTDLTAADRAARRVEVDDDPARGVTLLRAVGRADGAAVVPVVPAVLTVGDDGSAVLRGPDGSATALVADLVSTATAEAVARSLAPLRSGHQAGHDDEQPVPSLRQLLTATGPDPLDPDALTTAWRSPVRPAEVPLGVHDDGRPWTVDLDRDGPHALLAGTTGSGKSSLLVALVLAHAVGAPPDELGVVVVDYKGGATAGRLRGLPHLAGSVTDLDEHLARRALTSLAAEVRRRERLLAAHGVADRAALLALRTDGARLLPRLLVVVDEVRVLGEEVPELVPGLVRLAAVGRSLGVHLVLATQRPAGAVSADARANTNLRIALRVRDAADSLDVVDDDGAAALSSDRPGAALVRRGGEDLQRVRVAAPREAPPEPVSVTVVGGGAEEGNGHAGQDGSAGPVGPADEVPALVDALARAARGWPRVAPPWLPGLPELLTWRVPADASPAGASDLVLGVVDEPAVPARTPLAWSGREPLAVLGGPGCGRTSLLRWVAAAAAGAAREVLVVGDPAELGDLARLPGVRGVADPTDAEHLLRVLGACAADVAAGSAPVLLVDRADRVLAPGAASTAAGRAEADAAADLLRQLLDAGAPVVLTGDAALLPSRVLSGVREVLLLAPADRTAALLAGIPGAELPVRWPPGRALRVRSAAGAARPLECQLAVLGAAPPATGAGAPDAAAQRAVVAELAGSTRESAPVTSRCAALPRRLAAVDLPPHPPGSADDVVVGVAASGWASLPLAAGALALVSGPPGSGRTSALRLLAARAAGAGRPVLLVRPRPDPDEATAPGVQVLDAVDTGPAAASRLLELVAALAHHDDDRTAPGRTPVVLVDDAELLTGTAVEGALLGLLEAAGQARSCAVVVAATAGTLPAHRGPGAVLRRRRCGLLLHPLAAGDAEALATRPSPVRGGPPGRATLVVAGRTEVVHVALP